MESTTFNDVPTYYEGSKLSLRSELALASLPSTDISCLFSADYLQFFPLLPIRDQFAPVEFLINSDSSSYLDLSDSYLHVKCRIKKENGTDCTADDKCAAANLFFHLLWKNLDVYVNGKLIYDSGNMYSLGAYINRLLTTPQSLKDTKLRSEFWYPNETPNVYTDGTSGYNTRYTMTKLSQQFSMFGKIVMGLFQQNRYIVPHTEIRIVLRRNPANFCLDNRSDKDGTTPLKYKLEIDEAIMYVARKPVSPQIVSLHRSQLDRNETFKYIFNQGVVKTFTIPPGLAAITTESLLTGRIPKILLIGLVKSSALHGVLTQSPVNFEHFNRSNVCVQWSSESLEQRAIPLNFKTTTNVAADSYLLAYNSLRKAVGNELAWNGITPEQYTKGKFCSYKNLNIVVNV